MRGMVLTLGLAGCSFYGTPGATPDAAPSDAASDALPDAAPLGAWGAPVLIAELSSLANDDDPTLTADLLEVYFGSNRLGGYGAEDIWKATRASTRVPFEPPTQVAELSSFALDSNIDVSADGLSIAFTSERGGDADIWVATRESRTDAWSAPQLATGLNETSAGDWGAVLSNDRLTAVLCSDRSGDEALYTAERTRADAAFDAPVRITAVDTTADECDAMLADPQTLYFTRNTFSGSLQLDVYVAHRTVDGFGPPEAIAPLNTTSRDSDPWVSRDQRTLVFSSNRLGGAGFDDIYISTR